VKNALGIRQIHSYNAGPHKQRNNDRINKMPGAVMSSANVSIDAERLMADIHHTAQFGMGERWGE
jgi:hypothetical protein